MPSLHACASHHIDHKNTWLAPLERWHGIDQNTCRAHTHRMHGTLAKHMGTSELNVNRLTTTFSSNFGARYGQTTATYKCNQGPGWIGDDM